MPGLAYDTRQAIGGSDDPRLKPLGARAHPVRHQRRGLTRIPHFLCPEGHKALAGAIISGGQGDAASKIAALKEAGIAVAPSPAQIGETLQGML